MHHGDAVAGTLSLVRDAAGEDFDARDRALAQSLAPVLGLAYGIAVERAATARGAVAAPASGLDALAALTLREREVAALVVAGHANKEIARRLATSHWTVKNQLRAIFAKLGVHSRTGLCARLGGA